MSNVSDHSPIQMTVCRKVKVRKENNDTSELQARTKWNMVDKDLYKALVGDSVIRYFQI